MNLSLLVELKKITKNYHLAERIIPVLKGIDFQLNYGDMLAIMGASGSGKSTLMHILGCLDQYTTGEYYFTGKNISLLSEHELAAIRNHKIGFIFQAFFLLPRLTALENVMLPLFYRGIDRISAKKLATDALERIGMISLAQHRPNQLSGGQQQRVAIARALVGNPELILADEPTGALDSETGAEIMEILQLLNKQEGRTIVIITHDSTISNYCSDRIKMSDGLIVTEGLFND